MSNAVAPTGAPVRRPAPSPFSRRVSRVPYVVLGVLIVAYALFFGWISLTEYWAFRMHALDMGNMGQAAWNTIHGHPFYFTNMRPRFNIEAWGTTTRLSFHVEALFPLISLVYFIYPHPESLLVLQTAALAAGALPVFLLARDVLRKERLALVFAAAYLLYPTLEGMNLYEFHPVALATPLLLAAFLFAWRRRYVPFLLCSLAAMGTKEEIGLVVAMFGLYVALVNRDRVVGIVTAVAGVAWSLFAVLIVEHHYRTPGARSYVYTRYGYLFGNGHGLHAVVHTLIHDPGVILTALVSWPKAGYVNQLLAPVGYLPLGAPPALLLGLPTWLLNLFSSDFHMYSALGDNSAELVAVVMIAAILGCRIILRTLTQWMSEGTASWSLVVYLLLAALWNQHVNGFTPLAARFSLPDIGAHQRIQNHFVGIIPAGAPVATQDELDPALSSRHYLYLFPDTGRADYGAGGQPANHVLLDVSGPIYPLPADQLYGDAMTYIRRPGWGVAAADDGLILIQKGSRSRRIPPSFYTYAYAHTPPSHPLTGSSRSMAVTGYDVSSTDLANHRIPNLAYTIHMRPSARIRGNLQPVVYERLGSRLIDCAHYALGLAWLPTSRWQPGRSYLVRLQPLETSVSKFEGKNVVLPRTASLQISIQPVPHDPYAPCASLWHDHGRLWPAGSIPISF